MGVAFDGLKLWTIVAATAVQSLWASYLVFIQHASFFHRFRSLHPPRMGFRGRATLFLCNGESL